MSPKSINNEEFNQLSHFHYRKTFTHSYWKMFNFISRIIHFKVCHISFNKFLFVIAANICFQVLFHVLRYFFFTPPPLSLSLSRQDRENYFLSLNKAERFFPVISASLKRLTWLTVTSCSNVLSMSQQFSTKEFLLKPAKYISVGKNEVFWVWH